MPQSKRVRYGLMLVGVAAWNMSTFAAATFGHSKRVDLGPGESIQDAVDAASPGDTVIVKAGTYRESVRISTDGLTLRAHGGVTLKTAEIRLW